MYDDPTIVEIKEVKGFVGKDGKFYGQDDNLSRYANSTHRKCESCENICRREWNVCQDCTKLKSHEEFEKLESVVWDEENPLCVHHLLENLQEGFGFLRIKELFCLIQTSE